MSTPACEGGEVGVGRSTEDAAEDGGGGGMRTPRRTQSRMGRTTPRTTRPRMGDAHSDAKDDAADGAGCARGFLEDAADASGCAQGRGRGCGMRTSSSRRARLS